MFFKMKANVGNHRQRNRNGDMVTYTSGDVVESDIDLEERWPDKFERVDTPTSMTTESKKAVQEAAEKGAEGLQPPKEEEEEDDVEEEEDDVEEEEEEEEEEEKPKPVKKKKGVSVKKSTKKKKSGK